MLVQSHRDLLQAPRRDIVLGNSRTGCHTYAVNLWRVRLCLTSNSWYEDLEELKPADREWVKANTVVLGIKRQNTPQRLTGELRVVFLPRPITNFAL